MFRLRHSAGVKRVDPSGPRQNALSGAESILASPQDPSASDDPELGVARLDAARTTVLRRVRHLIPLEQEKHMTDQQSQGDFAAGERAEPQGPARDFAEGEERSSPGPPRDFAEGEEHQAPGPPRDFAEREERRRATPIAGVPPRPAAVDAKHAEPS